MHDERCAERELPVRWNAEPDSDGDSICNAQDNCPNVAGRIGSSCNDGDPCTMNDG
ncbi:MAG: hypothetical protein R2817_08945 [Flavobacteriales bacterium]